MILPPCKQTVGWVTRSDLVLPEHVSQSNEEDRKVQKENFKFFLISLNIHSF
jgi:hypothetical protein